MELVCLIIFMVLTVPRGTVINSFLTLKNEACKNMILLLRLFDSFAYYTKKGNTWPVSSEMMAVYLLSALTITIDLSLVFCFMQLSDSFNDLVSSQSRLAISICSLVLAYVHFVFWRRVSSIATAISLDEYSRNYYYYGFFTIAFLVFALSIVQV